MGYYVRVEENVKIYVEDINSKERLWQIGYFNWDCKQRGRHKIKGLQILNSYHSNSVAMHHFMTRKINSTKNWQCLSIINYINLRGI